MLAWHADRKGTTLEEVSEDILRSWIEHDQTATAYAVLVRDMDINRSDVIFIDSKSFATKRRKRNRGRRRVPRDQVDDEGTTLNGLQSHAQVEGIRLQLGAGGVDHEGATLNNLHVLRDHDDDEGTILFYSHVPQAQDDDCSDNIPWSSSTPSSERHQPAACSNSRWSG